MEEDFLKISKTYNAVRSILKVPALDPKYKIAVLASNQVHIIKCSSPVIFMYVNIKYIVKSLLTCFYK